MMINNGFAIIHVSRAVNISENKGIRVKMSEYEWKWVKIWVKIGEYEWI